MVGVTSTTPLKKAHFPPDAVISVHNTRNKRNDKSTNSIREPDFRYLFETSCDAINVVLLSCLN